MSAAKELRDKNWKLEKALDDKEDEVNFVESENESLHEFIDNIIDALNIVFSFQGRGPMNMEERTKLLRAELTLWDLAKEWNEKRL